MPNYISTNNTELEYYKTICYIQDRCLKGEISKSECEQKLEIERLKFIEYLKKCSEALMNTNIAEQQNSHITNTVHKGWKVEG